MQNAASFRLHDVNVLFGDTRLFASDKLQRHPFHELVYVVRGQYRVETLGVTWNGGPGWLYCYRPRQSHRSWFTAADATGSTEAILLQWTQEVDAGSSGYPHAYHDASRRWRHLLTWLLDLFTSGEAGDRRAAEQLLPVLLWELARAGAHTQSLVPAVNVYIADNLARPIRIRDLADTLGLSRSHFSRNFRKITGQSPQRYVIRTRLERARALLANPSLTLAEIAGRCGFSSASHLSRLYRQEFKSTPRHRQGS
jgi:AraC-like DNA-binding protein